MLRVAKFTSSDVIAIGHLASDCQYRQQMQGKKARTSLTGSGFFVCLISL